MQYNKGLQCCTLTQPSHRAARPAAAGLLLLPLTLPRVDYRQRSVWGYSLIIIISCNGHNNPRRSFLSLPPPPSPSPPSFPPLKPFTPLHYTNKANHPSGWCSHGPGRTCQQGEINGLHQRAGAAHKPPQHRAREIRLLLPYIFHEIIHYPLFCSCLWFECRVLLMSRAAPDTNADGDIQQLGTTYAQNTITHTCIRCGRAHAAARGTAAHAWLMRRDGVSAHEPANTHAGTAM